MVMAILSTIFCCTPLAIVATVFSAQVSDKLYRGDYAGAVETSRKAKTWASWSIGSALVIWVLYFLFIFGMAASGV